MKKPTINKITPNIENLCIYLRSIPKFGKTSLFRNVVLAKYNDPEKGLLVKCGVESGDTLLDDINSVQCETWQDFVDLARWLKTQEWVERDAKGKIISKETVPHEIKMVAFDVVSEFCAIAEKEICKRYNKENPTETPVTSINEAYKGFNRGVEHVVDDLLKPYFSSLKKQFGLWFISHTKFKTIREKGSIEEDGWMQLTSNLRGDYERAFGANFADIVLTGDIDHQLETKGIGKDAKNYATGEERRLYFRGTTKVAAGGRFAPGSVPDYMIFDKMDMGEDFVRVVEEGMRLSASTATAKKAAPVKEEPVKEPIKEPIKEPEPVVAEPVEEEEDIFFDEPEEPTVSIADMKKVIVAFVQNKETDASVKNEIKSVIKEHGKLPNVPEDVMKELYQKTLGE